MPLIGFLISICFHNQKARRLILISSKVLFSIVTSVVMSSATASTPRPAIGIEANIFYSADVETCVTAVLNTYPGLKVNGTELMGASKSENLYIAKVFSCSYRKSIPEITIIADGYPAAFYVVRKEGQGERGCAMKAENAFNRAAGWEYTYKYSRDGYTVARGRDAEKDFAASILCNHEGGLIISAGGTSKEALKESGEQLSVAYSESSSFERE